MVRLLWGENENLIEGKIKKLLQLNFYVVNLGPVVHIACGEVRNMLYLCNYPYNSYSKQALKIEKLL